MAGPWIKSDVVEVYAFRMAGESVEFLQLLRADGEHGGRLARTWQPMMGHIDGNETAVQTAERELREEVGLTRHDAAFLGLWALNSVRPYYMHARNIIMMSPCFAARVDPAWSPTLNEEHTAFRWVAAPDAPARFMWPGQIAAVAEIIATIARQGWEGEPIVRVWKR